MDTCISLLVSYIVILIFWGKVYAQTEKPFNVIDHGAVGDGVADDTQAFAKAWNATCEAKSTSVTLQIPKGKTFLVKQLMFQGPCKSSNINIQVAGKIVAPSAISDYPQRMPNSWLQVSNVDGLTINGGGEFNGRGQAWWNTCKGRVCKPGRPAMAIFDRCNNFRLQNLGFFNSSRIHILIKSCTNVQLSKLHVQSPGDTINTDGIDIAASNEVSIEDSVIGGGDDCVAITNESRNISITGVTCGPSHGISIGSLGEGGKSDTVEGIYVSNCTIQDSSNGARIKSYQGGAGYARNMTFKDIVLVNTSNPIFLDQYYCPERDCVNKTTTLKISDVSFRNIRGTTPSDTAILLHCSQETGCTNIDLDEITITSSIPGKQTHADCLNAHGRRGNSIIPSLTCLKSVV